MTLELCNVATAISRKFSRQFWGKALGLAQSYGWKPLGTCPPGLPGFRGLQAVWTGTYLTNDGQTVLTKDALSLANALAKALDDIPDMGIEMDWNPRFWIEDDLPEWLSPAEKALIRDGLVDHEYNVSVILPFEYFAGDAKQNLIEFIRFCMLGEFVIS